MLLVGVSLLLAGCAGGRVLTQAGAFTAPLTMKFGSPSELVYLRRGSSIAPKVIYVGVYGGEVPSWRGAGYFDPQGWPAYESIRYESQFNEIAFQESVMHVIAIQVARSFPNSITLMIRGDSKVLVDVITYLYSAGDKLYLVGHSRGGAVIGDGVYALRDLGIRVQLMAELEGFLSPLTVPDNVNQAFNFFVPDSTSVCGGRDKLQADAPLVTQVFNVPIANPRGPLVGLCAEHRNIDSDPRVWKTVLKSIMDSADQR